MNNDNFQVNEMVDSFISRFSIFKDYNEYYPCGCLPNEGLVFNTNKDDEYMSKQYLEKNGFSYTLLKSKHQMSIYKFEKS